MRQPTFPWLRGMLMTGLITLGVGARSNAQEGVKDGREITKTVALSTDGEVSIEAFKGSITIKSWDRPEVDILARIEAAGLSTREREAVNKVDIRIRESNGSVTIVSDYDQIKELRPSWNENWDGNFEYPFVAYTISMPRSAKLTIKDFKSEIKVTGLQSAVRIETFKGPLTVTDVKGDLRVNSYKGRVGITGLEGSLDLETQKSEVEIEFVRLAARSRVDSFKGEVQITLPKTAGFELDADIGSKGDIRSDFNLTVLSSPKNRRNNDSFRGEVNGGGPRLTLRTTKGYYRIRQK